MEYRKDLQIIRAIAVIIVVLYHLELSFFKFGFLGVDIFFVLSGFLMAQLYERYSLKQFILKRLVRLMPAYLIVIIVTVIVSTFIVLPHEYKQLVEQSWSSFFLFPNIFYWEMNSYFSKSDFKPLLHLWSLGIELQFYLIFPLLFFFIKKNIKILCIFIIISIMMSFIILNISPKTAFFLLPFRLWEFLIGYMIYLFLDKSVVIDFFQKNKSKSLFILIILLIISLIFYPYDIYSQNFIYGHPGIISLIVSAITGFFILIGFNEYISKSIFIPFIKLGDYSYSIYLIHFPIIIIGFNVPFEGNKLFLNGNMDILIILILTFGLSLLSFKYIEQIFKKINSYRQMGTFILISGILLYSFTKIGYFIQNKIYTDRQIKASYSFFDRDEYRCGTLFRMMNLREKSCNLSNQESNDKILLVGDSHMDSIKYYFSKLSQNENFSTYLMVQNKSLFDSKEYLNEVISEIKNKKIKFLVLHDRYNKFNNQIFDELMKFIIENKIFVYYIAPVPEYKESIPKVLFYEKMSNDLFPKYDAYIIENQYLDFLKGINNHYFKYISMYDLFCKNNICIIEDDFDKPLYFDTGHLTLAGNLFISSKIKEIISDIKIKKDE